jgi:hypothetical protein
VSQKLECTYPNCIEINERGAVCASQCKFGNPPLFIERAASERARVAGDDGTAGE